MTRSPATIKINWSNRVEPRPREEPSEVNKRRRKSNQRVEEWRFMALSFIRYSIQTISAVINDPQQRVCVCGSVCACVFWELSVACCSQLRSFIKAAGLLKTTRFAIPAALADVLLVVVLCHRIYEKLKLFWPDLISERRKGHNTSCL